MILKIWYKYKKEWFLSELIVVVLGEISIDLFPCLWKFAAFGMFVTTDYS